MAKTQKTPPARAAADQKRVLILSADGFEDSELLCPYYRLKEERILVDIAAPEKGSIEGKNGYSIEANLSFSDVKPEQYDMLFIPGGKAPETVRLDQSALKAARHFMEKDKPVAAICHGAQVLISAGVVSGRSATCWKGIQDDLKAAGAEVADQEVVVDGNLVSSRNPDDLPAFMREMVRLIRQ